MLVNSAITRGCGTRKEGGLYACVGGNGSMPLEGFVVDPVVPWTNGPFQGGIVSYQAVTGAYDLIMWVGAEYYPYVPDFLEEGRVHGFSKRIPTNLENLHLLSAAESRLVLVHPRAGYDHRHHLRHQCPTELSAAPRISRPDPLASGDCNHPIDCDGITTNCTFSLWDLSGHEQAAVNNHSVYQANPKHETANIETPSVTYTVPNLVEGFSPYDTGKEIGWYPAIFAVLPLTHFEYVTNDEAAIPAEVADNLGDNITRTFTTPT